MSFETRNVQTTLFLYYLCFILNRGDNGKVGLYPGRLIVGRYLCPLSVTVSNKEQWQKYSLKNPVHSLWVSESLSWLKCLMAYALGQLCIITMVSALMIQLHTLSALYILYILRQEFSNLIPRKVHTTFISLFGNWLFKLWALIMFKNNWRAYNRVLITGVYFSIIRLIFIAINVPIYRSFDLLQILRTDLYKLWLLLCYKVILYRITVF